MVEDAVVACAWVAGAREFLETHARRQPCFVVSATPQAELERILRRRQMSDFFAAAYGSPPEKTEILETVLRTWKLRPLDTIMIGDGLADYRAAKANGIRFLGRTHGGWRNPFPDGTETLEDLRDLERWTQLS
jgi:phosphoglycolate phosphatase-like HAD superfamily hydrolase